MDSSFQIKIIVPLIPLSKHDSDLLEYTDSAIAELLSLNNDLKITLAGLYKCKIAISLLENYKPIASRNKIAATAIVFETAVNGNSDSLIIEKTDQYQLTDLDKRLLYESITADEFRDKIYQFLILSQIAKPGSLKLREGDILVNDKLENFFYPFNSLHRLSLSENKKFKWPQYFEVKIIDAWNWYCKNGFSLQGQSKSKTERAINAFTYLFKDYIGDTEFDLFWSLVGIEALYCAGKEGLSEQIFTKSQIVLGEITDYKKRLKQMYEFRSRLVHGDLDIPPKHFDFDDTIHKEFHKNLYDSAILAVAILTATLQTMIMTDKKDLKFKYVVL